MPGYCSPTEGVKFADIPNGLAALSKVELSPILGETNEVVSPVLLRYGGPTPPMVQTVWNRKRF